LIPRIEKRSAGSPKFGVGPSEKWALFEWNVSVVMWPEIDLAADSMESA
jgi:hypothetical protein